MASAVSGYKRSFGSDGPPGAYEDMEKADVVILIGANIADNHPMLFQRLEQNPSKLLIVVDPRVSKTAMMADLHLPIAPRGDLVRSARQPYSRQGGRLRRQHFLQQPVAV